MQALMDLHACSVQHLHVPPSACLLLLLTMVVMDGDDRGVAKDVACARRLLEAALEAKVATALSLQAWCHCHGEVLDKDEDAAVRAYQVSRADHQQGHSRHMPPHYHPGMRGGGGGGKRCVITSASPPSLPPTPEQPLLASSHV